MEPSSINLSSKYWKKKVSKREQIVKFEKKQNDLLCTIIDAEELNYFNRLTNKNLIAQSTVVSAVYTFLLKRLISEFDGYVISSYKDQQNPLLLSFSTDIETSFKEYLEKVKFEILETLNYSDYSSNEIAVESKDLISLSNYGININADSKSECNGILLNIKIAETGAIEIQTTYSEEFIKRTTVERLIQYFAKFLIHLESNIETNLLEYPLLSEKEKNQLLVDFNATDKFYPTEKTIVSLFEDQVVKTPDNIAIIFNEQEINYADLNKKSNQLARYIASHYAVNKGDIIGVFLPKSDAGVISLLAILKLGAVYLPVDINYPQDRIDYLIKDSGLKLLITNDLLSEVNDYDIIALNTLNLDELDTHNINHPILPKDLAYVIYTSGSTGHPKGVMIEHTSNVNMSLDQIFTFEIKEEDKIVWFASVAFDASISEIMMSLYSGSTLCIPTEEVIKDKDLFIGFLNRNKATVATFPPSYLGLLSESDISGLRCVITAGEPANPTKAIAVIESGIDYYNAYGPTECAVCVSIYKVTKNDADKSVISIGKPISNTQVYILDDALNIVPEGITGKMYVAGAGLARGYLNKLELTTEKFVANPFQKGELMYDTGDMACWLPDGNIEFLGRKDQQVKLRGYRIELGEIENSISQYSNDLNQVVVEVKENNNEKVLVAYIVSNVIVDKTALRRFLQNRLPDYMIPGFYVALKELPITPNGKVDRKALPEISVEDIVKREYVAPKNETEVALTKIWQEVLGLEKIGITDDFFELGGHSLIVGQIINRIYKQLNKTISFKNFFAQPTIEGLSKSMVSFNYVNIPVALESESYPLTASQNRLWLLSQLEEGSLAYNMPIAVELTGKVDVLKFKESFKLLIARHEILRTSFNVNEEGEVRQFIVPEREMQFDITEIDFVGQENQENQIRAFLEQINNELFDLEKAPLLRASLIKLQEDKYVFFLSLHHIIGDGWSMELVISEIIKTYNALKSGIEIELPELIIQYKDYAVWLNNQDEKEEYKISEKYWINQFSGTLPVLELPSFKSRPLIQTYVGNTIRHDFSAEFLDKLKAFSKAQDVTLFMTLMSATKVLLHRYSGQEDIIVGTPIAGREHPDLENQIGLFLNTLAIRTQFNEKDSFLKVLEREKQTLLNAYEHQNYPFDALVGKLNLKRDSSRSAMFDVLVVLQNQGQLNNLNTEEVNNLEINNFELKDNYSKFDITCTFVEKDGLSLSINYNTAIYDLFLIERMFSHLENILLASFESPELEITKIDYLTSPEKEQVLAHFNATVNDFPKNKNIIDLFEEQVEKTPENKAVLFNDNVLTYKELNEKANQLAFYLTQEYALGTKDFAAVKLERSEWMIIAILGILKSGAAYVPIDINYPQERINYIEKDSNCKVVIDESVLESFSNADQYPNSNLRNSISPKDLSYVIYTSGTTGNPKGVMVEHKNVVNLIVSQTVEFDITAEDNILLFSNISFDASVEQLFLALFNGACLNVLDKNTIVDSKKLEEYIFNNKITHFHAVPSVLEKIEPKDYPYLKRVISGGDVCSRELASKWSKNYKFYNEYGPTETTVTAIESLFDKDTNFSIGRPLSNTQVYILNNDFQLSPIGVTGKLFIAGEGVTRGYLNKPELTLEKFITNPFNEQGMMYDSGDLAYWLPDGNIQFAGRKDQQVKIRGYRIELGEIEHTILGFSKNLQQAIVDVKEENKEKVLVAYLISSEVIDKSLLRNYLQEKLPDYMVPNFFIELKELPLTPNGKIDRKELPSISGNDLVRKEYAAPRNVIEKELAIIWQEVLGHDKIGITDNFFELGGHSLMFAQVINRTQKRLDKTVSFKTFFANPTIEAISNKLRENDYIAIPKTIETTSYPLTSSQNRLWILSQLKNGSLAYNMPGTIRLKGNIDSNKIEESFRSLIQRHEILRTYFKTNDVDEVSQYIVSADKINFKISTIDFSEVSNQEEVVAKYLHEKNNEPFILEQAPLLRVSLIKLGENDHLIFLTMHHIIGDGWSMELLIAEIVQTYNALAQGKKANLPHLTIQYKDYAVWLNDELQQEKLKLSESYWLQQFEGELPVLELPSFKTRPLVQTYNGDSLVGHFSNEFVGKLRSFSNENDVTLFMTLMAGINALLYRYTGQTDIILGTPIAGREHPDLENQLGMYLNTLPIRTNIKDNSNFLDLVLAQKELLIDAYQHQGYPFDALVEKLNIKKDTSRSMLFDVMVVLQNQEQLKNINHEEISGIEVENYSFIRKSSQSDIRFAFNEKNGLELMIDYNTDIYDTYLIERMFLHFENLMNGLLDEIQKEIQEVEFLTENEKIQVISEFNDTVVSYPKDKTIIALFEEQVQETPDNIALVFGNVTLTYKELNEKVNQLAHYLRDEYYIKPNDLVGIKLDRSEQMIITILSILKSGAAYVPIDTNYPKERIAYIEKDINCKVIIDEDELSLFNLQRFRFSTLNPNSINTSSDLAYVIYTSGSTGDPKGVMVEHGNVVRLVKPCTYFALNTENILLSTGSVSFDATTIEYFGTLLNGSRLVLTTQNNLLDLSKLEEVVKTNQVNSLWMTASWFNQVVENNIKIFENISQLIVGGDIVSPNHTRKVFESNPSIKIVNGYGPTENTTFSTTFEIQNSAYTTIPIGKPIPNSFAYILNKNLQPVATGVIGQLYVGGAGVSRGYLNKAELTAEKFILNPFVQGERLYDTGDLCKWLPDGNIEFLGRKDQQVKIRGFRIELGEIENVILQYSTNLNQVVVEVKEMHQEKILVAYLVSSDDLDKNELKAYLQTKLPEYMIPGFYVSLEELPLTSNGKTDRKALPGISGDDVLRKEYVAPVSENEKQLAAIWQEVLGIEKIGITDNFFELGGDSIRSIRLLSRINNALSVNYKLSDIYELSSIRELLSIKSSRLESEISLSLKQKIEEKFESISKEFVLEDKIESVFPVSDIESGMLYASFINTNEGVYHDQFLFNIPILKFDQSLFVQALELLVEKHEILRTAFNLDDYSEPVHLVHKSIKIELENEDISQKDRQAQHEHIKEFMVKERTENPFDISKPGLWRMKIYKTAAEQWHLLFQFHHAILDGWSLASFITELNNTHLELQNGNKKALQKLSLTYKDYVFNQNCSKGDVNQYKYWENKLEDHKRLDIFTDVIVSNRYNFLLEGALYDLLQQYSINNGISVKVLSFAAYLYTLQMLSYDNDITTGIVTSGRPLSDDGDKLLGCFLNTLPFRLTEFNGSVSEFVKSVNDALNVQKKFEGISLFELHTRFPMNSRGENPFFDTMFNYIDFHIFNELNLQEVNGAKESEFTDINFATNNTFLNITICPVQNGLSVSWNQQRLLKGGITVEKLQSYYQNFLELLLIWQSNTPLNKDLVLSFQEKEDLLYAFNTEVAYPKNITIIDLFEEQVVTNPDKVAVIADGVELTYSDLNQKANQLAHYLQAQGVTKDSNVILCFDSHLQMAIVGMIGILKSGAVYVPIDPDYPEDRINYIIENTGAKFIITNSIDNPSFNNESVVKILLDNENFDNNFETTKNIEKEISGHDGSYIIYTSGSTGAPKGVLVNHQNIIDYLFGLSTHVEIQENKSFALMSTISTDLGNTVLFSSLVFGGTIHLFSKNTLRDIYFIHQYFIDHKIDCIKIVPSYWKFLEIEGKLLSPARMIIFGGEELSTEIVDRIYLEYPNLNIVNHYGPTETTIGKLLHKVDPNYDYAKIPVGKAFSNTQLYVVDKKLSLCPMGVIGELLIGGDGVSDGYYNNETLTNEKFIENTFKENGGKLYKTGDLVLMHPDGNIEFKGRIDNQVKILGHRIELSEIEAVLNQFHLVKSSVVQVNETYEGDKKLVAYIVSLGEFTNIEIRKFLELHLPSVMIPTIIMEIDAIPLTSNGKVNRKALPLITGENLLQKQYVKPRDVIEEKLVAIWKDVLAVDQIGITDNFFELGGHSLLLGQIINRTHKQLGKTVSFKMFFASPTIEGLSRQLQQNKYLAIERAPEAASYPLTASQMRLWILSQLEGSSVAYNMPTAVKLTGIIDTDKFEEAFRRLIYRHEILRTYFKSIGEGEVQQFIVAPGEIDFAIAKEDYSLVEDQDAAVAAYLQETNNKVFNLEKAALLRASLIKLGTQQHVFFLSLHHIIGDGWSMKLLITEVIKNYNALVKGKDIDLPVLNIQYKDYAIWLNDALQQEKQKASEQYWLEQLAGELPVLDLPSFKTRPLIQTYNGERRSHEFSPEFLEQLKTFSIQQDATLFMTLMAGINTLLHKYTGQHDIIIGTPTAGREHPDLENQLGLYLNTLAIRTQFDQNYSFTDVVVAQKEILLGAYEHQNYPFDALVAKLNLKRDTSRSALFDVIVVLQSQGQLNNLDKEELSDLEVSAYELEHKTSKLDLNFTFIENEGLSMIIDYNSDIYDSYLIERMFDHFENLITASLAKPETLLHALEYLTVAEEYQLLKTFNDTKVNYPKDKTIIDLFEEQVARTPDNVAVVFEDKALTYKELNEKSNQLGHYIRENNGVQPDDLIGIKLERSERMIISIFAILKSGGAYVPIDPGYPQERIEYIEKDSNSKFVIDEEALQSFYKVQNQYSKENPEKINSPENLAYVIYTSGTTGNPKGTLLEHRNVVRLFFTERPLFDFDENDVWTMFHSYSFDFSVWEINGALLFGGKLVVVPKLTAQNTPAFLDLLYDQSVTILNQTPSSFYNLINYEKSEQKKDYKLRYVIFGGEALNPSLLSDWNKKYPETRLINMYGITETTVHVTYKEIGTNEIVSEQSNIGKPIPTLGCYILDQNKNIVSIGVFGELYITGLGLARGYLNRPELTAEKFIPSPFIEGEMMYKTGDLGRWLPDGDIEYVGRIDHQVKIRGFRIELGEIETAISQYSDAIEKVVVEVKEINHEKVLIAYLVSVASIDKSALRSFLQERLPDYMIPSFYVELDNIPLTSNGKVDRKALPAISGEDIIRKEYVAPETETEEKLMTIWQEILGIEKIGITDNFFELGGNSLSVMKLTGIIDKVFGVKISISDIFFNSNIKAIAFMVNELAVISISQNRKSKTII